MLLVRPAGPADIRTLTALARASGPGFTSLPADEAVLAARLDLSERSFAGTVAPAAAWYTLILEVDGEAAGLAGVRASVGTARPHFSFRVVTLSQYSGSVGTRFDHRALVLVNECGGRTEVGSLFVRADRRSGGAGALLARARYLLIGADPARFGDTVMAELRGWFDDAGRSPFWDGVASKFYRLPFEDADRLVSASDGQFIVDLAPRHPIYVELIAAQAAAAIGRVHRDGMPALALLEREGFERTGLIDIFDGGPTLACARDRIATLRTRRRLPVRIGEVRGAEASLVASGGLSGFRAARVPVVVAREAVTIEPAAAAALAVQDDDMVTIAA